jgi:hypothetical protein
MKYNIGDIIRIKFHREIKYIVITNHNMVLGQPAYEYIIQGTEGKSYWDIESNLETRELVAIAELLEDMAKVYEVSDR